MLDAPLPTSRGSAPDAASAAVVATVTPTPVPSSAPVPAPAARNVAVDAYRGFVMFLMMAEVLNLARVAAAFPGNWLIGVLAFHQTHVDWTGASLHDLIQPSFSLLVGVALPYSFARRLATDGFPKAFAHALWRSFLLVALGIFLRSVGREQTNFTFEDTLTQIGLGYPFLFLLATRSTRTVWTALGVILGGYWLAWALYPVAGAGYDFAAVGVPADWAHHTTGFAAHWNKNANLGHAFDTWFLNLFPRPSTFIANRGGYLTLSFVPTLGTMLLGLIAGRALRDSGADAAARGGQGPVIPMRWLLLTGAGLIAAGLVLHVAGLNPIVKRIWTPSWTLFSGGLCYLLLAGFSWVIDVKRHRRWAFPLVVIGLNSIAAYLIAHLWEHFISSSVKTHFGQHVFERLGTGLAPLVEGIVVLTGYWLVLYWMYNRKLFLRI
jgi:heparan-alpha-glucosaminide N-acetyltransferase